MPNLQDPARIALGKSTFESTCAAFCHGMEPPLFIGRQGLDPADAYTTISKGGGSSTPMPPWGDVFSNQEIWELVAYIDFLGTQKAGQPIVLPKANP
jgi:mono/diheme cytochrome c family protein